MCDESIRNYFNKLPDNFMDDLILVAFNNDDHHQDLFFKNDTETDTNIKLYLGFLRKEYLKIYRYMYYFSFIANKYPVVWRRILCLINNIIPCDPVQSNYLIPIQYTVLNETIFDEALNLFNTVRNKINKTKFENQLLWRKNVYRYLANMKLISPWNRPQLPNRNHPVFELFDNIIFKIPAENDAVFTFSELIEWLRIVVTTFLEYITSGNIVVNMTFLNAAPTLRQLLNPLFNIQDIANKLLLCIPDIKYWKSSMVCYHSQTWEIAPFIAQAIMKKIPDTYGAQFTDTLHNVVQSIIWLIVFTMNSNIRLEAISYSDNFY
jgi:hypothetical protein